MSAPESKAAALEAEAALWLIRREDADWAPQDEADLSTWLDKSMAHKAAFWRLEHGWREADRISSLGLDTAALPRPERRPNWLRRVTPTSWVRTAGVGAGAMLAVALTTVGLVRTTAPVTVPPALAAFRTPVGGSRTVKLADGSRVQLNTATRIRADEQLEGREVWLDAGEAFFDIVHRPDRQFVVHAGSHTITVLGTRFSVRRDGDRITVAVLSGRVRVDDTETSSTMARTALISTGNVALIEPRATLVSTTGEAKVAALTAWREQMIVFDDKPLAEVVAEFNRYTTRTIRIADPALARVHVGGAFKTSDGDSFVNLLRIAYGVRVKHQGEDVILSD